MSTPGDSGPSEPKDVDRRRSLGKYVKRMSSVFKREKPARASSSSAAGPTPSISKVEPKEEEEKKVEETKVAEPAVPAVAPTPTVETTPTAEETQELNRSEMQQERARLLFAKYGLTLESHEWITAAAQPISVQRVEKPIRMRVHRSCHHCSTIYGADKVCVKCEHKRCKKCPRYPKKKAPGEKAKQKEKELAEAPKKKKKLLTVTTRAGDERAYQPVKQRVRRTCHKCETLFIPPSATICEGCRHIRCTKCPREPAKLSKWPSGYPGDAEPESEAELERIVAARRIWRRPRMRVKWECEECHSLFIDGVPQCPGCGHERCEKCTRKPLKKTKREREFDPEVIRAVEEKLRALAVEDDPPTSSAEAT